MCKYDQFQDACCWEREKIPEILYDCYQYLFFLQSIIFIGVLIFQVGESSVQGEGNSIVCGTVTAVCKL